MANIHKKEFLIYSERANPAKIKINERLPINSLMKSSGVLVYQPHQKLVDNWMDPTTNNNRLLAKHDAGTGKTLLALGLTERFAKIYQDMFNNGPKAYSPTIFIISYVKHNYYKDLMTRPEFGFISEQELEELKRLRSIADTYTTKDSNVLKDFEIKIKKRLSNRQRGGFYKFMGYGELFNKLFKISPDIHETAIQSDEAVFLEFIKTGKISINLDFLDSFANSVMVCDEIHNAYNSIEMNNYGMAIKIIVSIFQNPNYFADYIDLTGETIFGAIRGELYKNSGLKLLLLSATPYNSVGEIVDLINILVPLDELPNKEFLKRDDIIDKAGNLLPTSEKIIKNVLTGKISFLRDSNVKLYPEKVFHGESIAIPKSLNAMRTPSYKGKYIPYVKFTRCNMSKLHLAAYKEMTAADERPTADTINIYDMVFPSPDGPAIYSNKKIKALGNASDKWLNDNGIVMGKKTISGTFWRADNIVKYSTKYATILHDAIQLLRDGAGKLLISHQNVSWAGVLGLQELFTNNGYISENSPATDETLCSICGVVKSKHNTKHDYKPARVFVIHGGIDKGYIDRIKERYNSKNNLYGHEIAVVIGSEILNVGLDFTAIQNLWIAHKPDRFSILIQIIHRGVRNGSHLDLPPEKRKVNIKIYTHRLPGDIALSFEEESYFIKSQEYVEVQKADKFTNMVAIDTAINKNKIFPPGEDRKDFETFNPLYFDIKPISLKQMETESYNIWYRTSEINSIMYVIKRLFAEQSQIWKYDALRDAVYNPPFDTTFNTQLIDDKNFKIALKLLLDAKQFDLNKIFKSSDNLVRSLYDHVNKYIYISGTANTIVHTGEYYIMVPVLTDTREPGLLGYSYEQLNDEVQLDISTWKNQDIDVVNQVDITAVINTSSLSYTEMKQKFNKTYINIPTKFMPYSFEIYHMDFHTRLIQDCIEYMFDSLTGKNPKSEFHDLYIKMMYFYDHLDIIIFANMITESQYYAQYKNLVSTPKKTAKLSGEYVSYVNPLLMDSIFKSSGTSNFNPENINEFLGKKHDKIPSNILPIGYSLEQFKIKLYDGTQWTDVIPQNTINDVINNKKFTERENDIVIGFTDRASNSLSPKFKVRDPLHKIVKSTDIRMLKTGMVCEYKLRKEIIELAKQLGLQVAESQSIKDVCEKIKLELMKREMIERNKLKHLADSSKKHTKIRWYYMAYETQPDII